MGRVLKNRSSPVVTHHSICWVGGKSQKPLLGESIFEPTFNTVSCWLRIRNTKLSTQTFILFAVILSFSLFPTTRKSWRQWKNIARNRWNYCTVSKRHINCRIHAWFHTRRRCVLEKLMLTQIVGKSNASLHSWFQAFAVFWMSCVIFWVVHQLMPFNSRRFGTLCLFQLHRRVDASSVPKCRLKTAKRGRTTQKITHSFMTCWHKPTNGPVL
jgi:hypothetical protein